MAEIVTANRLVDGIVVFLGPHLRWVDAYALAAVFTDEAAKAEAMAAAKRSEALNEVVEPYFVEVVARGGGLAPKSLREEIRANGPTIRTDLGKQAQGAGISAQEGVHVSV